MLLQLEIKLVWQLNVSAVKTSDDFTKNMPVLFHRNHIDIPVQ